MKQISTLVILAFFLFSCSDDNNDGENQDNDPLFTKMSYGFGTKNQEDLYIQFEYDSHKRLIKKTGGIFEMDSMTGYSSFYTDQLYTTFVYSKNKVTIENFDTIDGYTAPKNTSYVTLNNEGQIVQKDIPPPPGADYFWYKRKVYSYSGNKLTEIKTSYPDMPHDPNDPYVRTVLENFYYDSNGNLSKVETHEQINGEDTSKIVRVFEDYDNSYNYMKRLYLLDEYFYSTISKNNFRKYNEKYYNYLDELQFERSINWTYQYDSNGNIITEF